MPLPKRYNPSSIEPALQSRWELAGTYHFNPNAKDPVYSIDTPPPTISGKLHLGHIYSYSHPDFIARFWRMNGHNVFYPMGFDDNGLPTERLIESQIGKRVNEYDRQTFIEKCLQISEKVEEEYKELWQRLGLSIDWKYTYRTINRNSRFIAQLSFLQLYQRGFIYRKEAPTIWCPECRTAIAQAELNDLDCITEFLTLKFPIHLPGKNKKVKGENLLIATTRPELLPACVAIFMHPEDERYSRLAGEYAEVPIFSQKVPILADPLVKREIGTGIVMCCTFGDQTDIKWWHTYNLALVEAINKKGEMTQVAGNLEGCSILVARDQIKKDLAERGYLVSQEKIAHTIRVHERCDTPAEFISTPQWFVRVLDQKGLLLAAGNEVNWIPGHMKSRFQAWVENLNWDWCISRQRYYGVAFPLWYCADCKTAIVADEHQLPVDPLVDSPKGPCPNCGSLHFTPEEDVMDTWATSSLSPQIVGKWLEDSCLYGKVYPFSLRPQAHEIIRTWAFYTILKSVFHFATIPWKNVLISGWGIAGVGMGKISKSRGGGPISPAKMLGRYSADAIRYWAASTGPGKDALISEEKIQIGAKLVNKIWNVALFSSKFLGEQNPNSKHSIPYLTPADKWTLTLTQKLTQRVTSLYRSYDYAAAKAETEAFFWHFSDNYIEMVKQRLYDENSDLREGAIYTLHHVLLTMLKLFAPILPYVTEYIYQGIFAKTKDSPDESEMDSIHKSSWPTPDFELVDERTENFGDLLLAITTHIRRFKSEQKISLGTDLKRVKLATCDSGLRKWLDESIPDLKSISRAKEMIITKELAPHETGILIQNSVQLLIDR
jgi:valyl-tRNA synthetase